ncbi:MAG: DUF342 domain-containing protein [Fidelibacterota bacterium]|nr:MAG: DUF342 domain-containing protein [Candidatus Neomarinimicrobiota bacterium]
MPATRKKLDLPSGVLLLTSFDKNRLILAELTNGSANKDEILAAVGQAGIRHGLINSNVDLLCNGQEGQVPLARAEVMDLPAQITDVGLDLPVVEEVAESGSFELLDKTDVTYPVKAGEILLTMGTPPKTIVRYPDGQERLLREHTSIDPGLFSGENTSVNDEGDAVIAAIDGLAHRTIFGSVAVYGSENASSVNNTHGILLKGSALIVEQDINEGSHVETVSNLVVRGTAHGAHLKAAGNIQIVFPANNPTHHRDAILLAGQSVRCRSLENIPVQAGSNVVSVQGIIRCNVQCVDTVVTPTISGSTITIGNRLIVQDVKGNTRIKLGTKFLSDPDLASWEVDHSQYKIHLSDLEKSMLQRRSEYNKTRDSLVRQIEKLRDPKVASSQKQKAKQMLIRLINSMNESLEACREDLDEYVPIMEKIARGQVALDYYQLRLKSFDDPHILVFGTMDTGTLIEGPVDTITLKEPFRKGRIGIDQFTGKLTFSDHNPETAS